MITRNLVGRYVIENMDDVGRSIKSKYECLLFGMKRINFKKSLLDLS